MSKLIGIIPAAGLGTRMAGFHLSSPKALIKVEGKMLIENAIESLVSIGVSHIVVVIGHRGAEVRDYLAAREFPVQISFAHQEKQLGLAHAIATASDLVTNDFVVFCPDNIYSDAADLAAANAVFLNQRPPFLMIATVTPTHQRDRAKYLSRTMRSVGPHVYEYKVVETAEAGGLAMNSTGCTFFRHESLASLPSFASTDQEISFHVYLTQLATTGQPLIYLLHGMRYDFSGPQDLQAYCVLRNQLHGTKSAGVSAILLNQAGEVLLQHRDDNPAIRYPNHWALFGGSIEPGETAHAAARREILEETGYNVENLGLFREFVQNEKREFAFIGEINASLEELSLTEGQGMDFIRASDLPKLLIRPDDKETLKAYFGAWDE